MPPLFFVVFLLPFQDYCLSLQAQPNSYVMISVVDISFTPMAPYIDVIDSMSQREKLAVVAYLINTLQGDAPGDPRPVKKHVKRKEEFSDEDRRLLEEKINSLKSSARIERLTELQHDAAAHIDIADERTRYMLGL